MAGVAGDIRAPYPMGDLVVFPFNSFQILASKSSDWIVGQFLVPFAFRALRADFTATVLVETNAITINLQDDTGTPQEVISDSAISAAITDGGGGRQTLTVDGSKLILAGAVLSLSFKSGASDTATDAHVTLWVRPTTK